MKAIALWLNKRLVKYLGLEHQYQPVHSSSSVTCSATTNHNEDFYRNYFSLIAAGARLKLVEAMFRLNFFVLFEKNNQVLERDIIEQLGLMPIRAKKWLHLLCCEHFLIPIKIHNQAAYQLPERLLQLVRSNEWWAMRFFYNNWVETANKDLSSALQFGKLDSTWSWPPKTKEQAQLLENWMAKTAKQTIDCMLDHLDFKHVKSFLDVGGGDGTMASAFVSAYPHLKGTVYNLPHSTELAKENIEAQGLTQRVHVIEGNFIKDDAFPLGFDLILFLRVLMDWGEGVCRKLLRMAYQALPKGGLVAICEIFLDENHDTCLACEYGYIFYDDFDAHVMKEATEYQRMLEEIGFTVIQPTLIPKSSVYYCSLILARK